MFWFLLEWSLASCKFNGRNWKLKKTVRTVSYRVTVLHTAFSHKVHGEVLLHLNGFFLFHHLLSRLICTPANHPRSAQLMRNIKWWCSGSLIVRPGRPDFHDPRSQEILNFQVAYLNTVWSHHLALHIALHIALHWLLHIILISRCFLGVGCHLQATHLQIVGSDCADYHVPDLSLWVGIVICSRKMLLYQLWYDRLATFTIFSARRGQIDAND